jgi:ethanolamine utilization protein EutN/carbon dioxide concentrating mechanism protein CcmL
MQVGIVRGSVVSTNKAEKLHGLKLLIVKPINIETFEEKGDYFVAIDAVGAGEGEVVICVGGSSSRQTSVTENKPVDQSIVAILDSMDINGKRVFEKFKNEPGKTEGKK